MNDGDYISGSEKIRIVAVAVWSRICGQLHLTQCVRPLAGAGPVEKIVETCGKPAEFPTAIHNHDRNHALSHKLSTAHHQLEHRFVHTRAECG